MTFADLPAGSEVFLDANTFDPVQSCVNGEINSAADRPARA
jgi:hypothetical protein